MNKLITICLAVVLFLFIGSSAFAVQISIVPERDKVHVGENLLVDFFVSGLQDGGVDTVLGAFEFDFLYDASFFTLLTSAPTGLGPHLGNPSSGGFPEVLWDIDSSTPGLLYVTAVSLLESDEDTCLFCDPPYLDDLQRVDPNDPNSAFLDSFRLLSLNLYAPFGGNPGMPVWRPMGSSQTVFDTQGVVLSDAERVEIPSVANPGTSVSVPEPPSFVILITGLILLVGNHRLIDDERRSLSRG